MAGRYPHRWQLYVLPFAGVLLGLASWVVVGALAVIIMPVEWVRAAANVLRDPAALAAYGPLSPGQQMFLRWAPAGPPLIAVGLFLLGYYIALRNNRPGPTEQISLEEAAPDYISLLAGEPTDPSAEPGVRG